MKEQVAPDSCQTMSEIRQGIDALDHHIVTLLAERMRYIEAAARVKPERGAVRDETRKAEVIENACRAAQAEGLDPKVVGEIYELLVERSIAHEFVRFDAQSAA